MEAPPAAAFIVCGAELLLEFLIVALDTPTHLGVASDGPVERKYFTGSAPPSATPAH